MKLRKYSRKLAAVVAICLIMTTGALAAILGQFIDGYDVYLGAGMELSKGVYWTGSDYRTENYIEYSPSSDVYPVVVSGSRVCNVGNFSSMAALLENQGRHVIAGINGDYYVLATNMPLGIVVENGKLRSSDGGSWAVGFRPDGTAIFGKPNLDLNLVIGSSSYILNGFNKVRASGTAVIVTDDFATATKSSGDGVDVVCVLNGAPTVNTSLSLTVERVVESSGSMPIPDGRAIISIDSKAGESLINAAKSLAPGDSIQLNISCAAGWESVSYAIGSLYKLVTDGKIEGGLTTDVNPRTAVGMKADGSLVFYTIDGRQSGHSVGVTMTQLAQRMLELGCVEATIMDGGGSTSLNAIYIGNSSVSQINSPSDGQQRSVTDYIMLVTDKKATGTADRLAIYPLSANLLLGAATTFTVKAADANGYSAPLNGSVSLSVGNALGAISPDGKFTATAEGRGSIVAEGEGLVSASVNVNVVTTPDTLRVFYEGKTTAVTSLSVKTDSVTALMAQAMSNYVYLTSQDKCYTWAVTGDIGSIDGEGNFTAGADTATGAIIVSAGNKSVSIPVTVTRPGRYDDVKQGSWYYDAVEFVSENALMNGTAERVFSPDTPMSRAMVVTVLHRLEGAPAPGKTSGFSDVKDGQWYTSAVYWANEKGIVEGYGGKFDPNGDITREQLAAIFYRYYGSPEVSGDLTAYKDASKVSVWAKNALLWATQNGIINGTDAETLSPKGTATRAQVATILYRINN